MNAFAAQVILSDLKAPDQPDDIQSNNMSGTCHGLPAFIAMEPQERLQRFEGLLGGCKLLTHASTLIDADWAVMREDKHAKSFSPLFGRVPSLSPSKVYVQSKDKPFRL